jgi:hypothetical protein
MKKSDYSSCTSHFWATSEPGNFEEVKTQLLKFIAADQLSSRYGGENQYEVDPEAMLAAEDIDE